MPALGRSVDMDISAHGSSHSGHQRPENEDAWGCDVARGFFAVADGLGGLPDGALASHIAIDVVDSGLKSASRPLDLQDLAQLVRTAHAHVLAEGHRLHPDTGIGTTLTLALVQENELLIGHAGDSAAFLWDPDSGLKQLTGEHTLAALYREKVPPGEVLPAYFEHTLTQCLGMSDTFEPSFTVHTLSGKERLLLCTDGVTKVLSTRKISTLISRARSPESAVKRIEEAVLKAGAPDNLTQLVVFFD